MENEYLFTTTLLPNISFPATSVGAAGLSNNKAQETSRTGIIKTFYHQVH